ncbi:mediator complex subunit Med15 [Branchiostoma belcheri]|nr:mediator complex subunit Med15 [Branchiostoma belcheri]
MAPSPRNATEEQAYLEKWKQLSKYIDPLQRMIKRVSNTDGTSPTARRIARRPEGDPIRGRAGTEAAHAVRAKRVRIVLWNIWNPRAVPLVITRAGTPVSNVIAAQSQQHMCQPLLDAVASQLGSPMLNHTLKRTFGPALTALHGPPICFPGPPPKRQRTILRQECSIPNILQGEVAKLDQKFKVSLDPTQNNSSTSVHLVCKLDDRSLPSVPPIFVVVPEQYPEESPQCTAESHDYGSFAPRVGHVGVRVGKGLGKPRDSSSALVGSPKRYLADIMEQKFDAALPYERREKLRTSRRRQWCQPFLKFPSAREHFRLLPTRAEDESRGLPRPFPTLTPTLHIISADSEEVPGSEVIKAARPTFTHTTVGGMGDECQTSM